jgi:hypothetical protein
MHSHNQFREAQKRRNVLVRERFDEEDGEVRKSELAVIGGMACMGGGGTERVMGGTRRDNEKGRGGNGRARGERIANRNSSYGVRRAGDIRRSPEIRVKGH